MRRSVGSIILILLGCFLPVCFCWGQKQSQEIIKDSLNELSVGKGELGQLKVTYDDLHGLHGGLRLEIRGNGMVIQKAVRKKVDPAKKKIGKTDLMALINILIEQQAWVQRTPERDPVPDESRAKLTIVYAGHSSVIWEWYNDLKAKQRIIVIRELMKRIARQKKGQN